MGMEQAVVFADGNVPEWEALRDFLGNRGFPLQMRMIDGQLAFPDEAPPADWKELRLGTSAGMITVRREPARLVFVTWGNADRNLLQAWNALTWASAILGKGAIHTEKGVRNTDEFQREVDLPPLTS